MLFLICFLQWLGNKFGAEVGIAPHLLSVAQKIEMDLLE